MTAADAALITALQALIAARQADAAVAGASAATITDVQQAVFHAQAVIRTLQVLAAGTPGYTVTVAETAFGVESIFFIAERELGSLERYVDILRANKKAFIALSAGETLLIPHTA